MKNPNQQNKLTAAWLVASNRLSFRVQAPYSLKSSDGNDVNCVAFLPDFGSPNGMVIGHISRPNYEIDKLLKQTAESRGLFLSFIYPEAYEAYNETVFKEALFDWGFFGNEASRPAWMKKRV